MKTMNVFLADIRRLAGREAAALPLLTPERRAAVSKTKLEQDRLHCVAAGLLLRQILGVTGDADLLRDAFGKRSLANGGACFNLSHGGNYAVLAVFDSPVGIDIEPVGEKLPIRIPKRYLQPDELAWLEREQTPERFAQLWTRLESAIKADGRGFSMGQREFSVLNDGTPWHLKTWFHDNHCISCAAGDPFEIIVNDVPTEVLLKHKKP